ncbi:MAG TPA: hypothetical protein VHT70_01810 [Candidatus Saccharimonadales bacterium]|nr:hypothetical protein [Candidatus Saccharimonadales bacterium]
MKFVRKRWWIIVVPAVIIALGIGGLWLHFRTWHTTVAVSGSGGSAWSNHGVGIRVTNATGKATRIALSKGTAQPKTPLDTATDQLGDAVEITPNQNIAGQSQVLFKVPANVPTNVDCSKTGDAAKNRPRSICNAGIEVYNTDMQGWVPLPTTIEHGNVLMADAPHYSEYREVWAKIGDVTLSTYNGVVAHFQNDTTPDVIVGKATVAFFQQMFNNLTGRFDQEKLAACEKSPNDDFTIDFQQSNADIMPCVIKQGAATKLLVGDGIAIPIAVTANLPNGITPDEGNETEVTTALRNKVAQKVAEKIGGGKTIIVSGLDTGTFTIDPDHMADADGKPASVIPMQSSISWTATGGDYMIAVLSMLFNEERVAQQVDKIVDAGDCMATGLQKIPSLSQGEIPDKLAEIIKGCALPAGLGAGMLEKIGVPELAGTFLKSTKLLAESFQIGENISTYSRTGHGKGDSAFTVTNATKALTGHWINQCAGRDDAIDFLDEGDSWVQTELNADNGQDATYSTYFKLVREEGKPFMEIDDTDMPGLHKGQKLSIRYQPAKNGYSAMLFIDDHDSWYFWNDNNGMSPC